MNDHQQITAERGRRAADLRAAAVALLEQQTIAAGVMLDLDSDQVVAAGPKSAILYLLSNGAPATASGDELPPLPFADPERAIANNYTMTVKQAQDYARAAVSAATKPTADSELEFNATRLRNVAKLVGLEKSIPEDDATLDGARGSVLGLIAGALRNAATKLPSERDMAIAQAVRQACCNCYSPDDSADDWSDKMGDIDLASIIARFPYAATKPTADLSKRLREHDDARLYREADVLMAEAADEIDRMASLLATKPAAAPEVPEGFVLVPLEPTVEQLQAKLTFDASGCQMGEIYRAMLAATPAASTTGAAQTAEQVRDQALEDAAEICDDRHHNWRFGDGEDSVSGPKECAAAIRALKRPTPTHSSEAGDA